MDLANLARDDVLRTTDVTEEREQVRMRRLRRLFVILVLISVPLVIRAAMAVVAVAEGRRPAALHVPFHIPAGWEPFLPSSVLILILLLVMVVPMLGAGRSPHVLYRPEEIDTTLSDVVGADTVVEEVVKTLNLFLAHKTFRSQMGGSARRGVLFEGPPGTGKTYIAKAMAAEAGVPFLFVSSSAFQSMLFGQTNRKIRSYFKALRAHARREGGAIGFIEEIDAIGAARTGLGGSGSEGVAGVVNELLVQLQSFDQPTGWERSRGALIDMANRWLPARRRIRKRPTEAANVLVIGATNRAGDLDPALVRPGRFDRTITVDLPSRSGRREILDYYLARKAHDAELDLPKRRDDLAAVTFGYSPVMLERLLDEALVWAIRRGAGALGWEDVQRAKMTTELGVAQPAALGEEERRSVATHEAGHATVAWLVAPDRNLEVLSIIKRRSSLGLLAHSDAEERWTRRRSEIEAGIRIAMGGLVAEDLFFGETGSGVAGDLQAATQAAAQMVGSFGMAGTLVSLDAVDGPGRGNIVAKVIAEEPGRKAVEAILDRARRDVTDLLAAHRHLVIALRDALLERDELIGAEIGDVLRGATGGATDATLDLRDAAGLTD
jgi:cell division protease FtsH